MLDILGRVKRQYYPVTSGTLPGDTGFAFPADPSNQYVENTYDGLGRLIRQDKPKPNASGTDFCYTSTMFAMQPVGTDVLHCTTTTDEMQRYRKSLTDPLGRVRWLWEPDTILFGNVLKTESTYDPMDQVLTVDRKNPDGTTGQVRLFEYDRLGRMTRARLPEFVSASNYNPTGEQSWEYDSRGKREYRRV